MNQPISYSNTKWKNYEKVFFRFFFIFFLLLIIPIDWKFYKILFSHNWIHANFYEFFSLTTYLPYFFSSQYTTWLLLSIISAIGSLVWGCAEKKKNGYEKLNYWLRVILRYRLAIGIIAYGLIKLFPLQMPYPSLSNLHTNYGDFAPWKIYYHTIGIAPWYESFIGSIEILSGFLLFFRKTTAFGAGIVLGFIGNVLAANIAYDMGEQVYCFFLFLISGYLLTHDITRLYTLLIERKKAIADKFQPRFSKKSAQIRYALKSFFLVFVFLLGIKTYANYSDTPYKLPKAPGLLNSYGYYNVSSFVFNNDSIPYSISDSTRWQNVIFEKWATISIKTARPIQVDYSNSGLYQPDDIDRNFESAGVGGRRYFAYTIDTIQQRLYLKNKNPHHIDEKFELHYSWLNDSTLLLTGFNEHNDVISAELNRINKKYLLSEGRRKPLKL